MVRVRVLSGLWLLGWLVLCPLASAGVFAACHDDEQAMDCCLPHEGSGPQPLSKVLAAVAPTFAPVALVEVPRVGPGAGPLSPESMRTASGPRRHSLLSVFLI